MKIYDERVKEFSDKLRAKAKKWSANPALNLGIKLIPVGGEFIRDVIINQTFDEWWIQVESKLPDDAILMDIWDGEILLPTPGGTTYKNSYQILFGSTEWELVPDNSVIPLLELTFVRTAAAK